MLLSTDTSACSPLPSSGSRGRPSPEPCASPPSSVLWVRKIAPDPSPTPPVSLGRRVPRRWMPCSLPGRRILPSRTRFVGTGEPPLFRAGRSGALPGSWEIPVTACPGLETPAVQEQARANACPDAAFRYADGVGTTTMNDFGADPRSPPSRCVRFALPVARSGATLATGLPATALAGWDLHPPTGFQSKVSLAHVKFLLCQAWPGATAWILLGLPRCSNAGSSGEFMLLSGNAVKVFQ
jgi:hypothetical protein